MDKKILAMGEKIFPDTMMHSNSFNYLFFLHLDVLPQPPLKFYESTGHTEKPWRKSKKGF